MIEPDWDGEDVKALDDLVAHALFDGSEVITQKLCNIAADLIERGEQLPDTLKLFTVTFLRYPGMKWKLEDEPKRLTAIEEGRRSPGPDQHDWTWRNA